MDTIKIGVIGLGYVGLPLARLFATKYPVIGFDINKARVRNCKRGRIIPWKLIDATLQSVLQESPTMKRGSIVLAEIALISGSVIIIWLPSQHPLTRRTVLS